MVHVSSFLRNKKLLLREMYLATVSKVHAYSQKDEENKIATVDSKTQEVDLQSLLYTVGYFNLCIYFFPKLGHRQSLRLSGQDVIAKCLGDQNVNSNITETHTFQNIKRITKKQTQKLVRIQFGRAGEKHHQRWKCHSRKYI